jgi:aspartyl-tRNA(Asn)/glutamyl-tRNA(Gln) amidotransferase subunit A
MTGSVKDAALLLDVVSGFDARDWSALPLPTAAFRDRLDGGVSGSRIAYSADLGYAEVDPEVAASVRRAADVLAGLGTVVEEVDRGFADPVRAYHVPWFSSLSALDYLDAVAERMALGVRHGGVPRALRPARHADPADPRVPRGPVQPHPAARDHRPCGTTAAGLPVGLQIIGPRHADERVLGAAAAYQEASMA